MDKKVIKNYLYNLSYQILVILVPLITTPYVSRVLGASGIGTFSYTNSIVQYFILFGCIGMNLYGQREIAYYQHDKVKRDQTFWEIITLRIFTILISLIIYLLTLVFFENTYSFVFVIMSLDIIASAIDISWFFQGIEDFKKIVIRNFFVKIIGVILIFLFVKTSDDLLIYILCHSVTLFLGNISMWMYVPRLINKIDVKSLNPCYHLKPTLALFIPQIAISLYTIFDKTMIGLLTNSTNEVAYYEQSQKIIKIVLTVVTSLTTVLMPRIANLYQQNDFVKIKEYILSSVKFICVIAFPMTFGIMALSNNLVSWFFGDGFDKVIPNMMIISPIIICIAFSGLFGTQYLLAIGRQKEYSTSVLVGTFTNFIINLLLIPKLFSLGAAISTVIAESCVIFVQLYFIKNEFKINELFEGNLKYIISSIIMFIPIYYLSITLESSIINTFFIIFIGILLYGLSLIIVFKDNLIIDLIKRVVKKK